MANDRPNLKQIRIKRSICDRLDERKDKDDSYTDVIKALLDENERLKEHVEELKQDKKVMTDIAVNSIFKGIDEQHVDDFGEAILNLEKERQERIKLEKLGVRTSPFDK